MKEFFAGLTDSQNRRDFFGTILIAYAFIALSLLCIFFASKPQTIKIIVPMNPEKENHTQKREVEI